MIEHKIARMLASILPTGKIAEDPKVWAEESNLFNRVYETRNSVLVIDLVTGRMAHKFPPALPPCWRVDKKFERIELPIYGRDGEVMQYVHEDVEDILDFLTEDGIGEGYIARPDPNIPWLMAGKSRLFEVPLENRVL